MGFMDFLFGKGEKMQQLPSYTPQQQNIMSQLSGGAAAQLPQAFQYLQSILSQDPEMMKQFEAPMMRQFEEQTIPGIAERFTGMDAQKSSAFGQQLGAAGAGLQENLAAQRAQMGPQAIQQLMQMLQGGMGKQFENVYSPRQSGFLENLLGGFR